MDAWVADGLDDVQAGGRTDHSFDKMPAGTPSRVRRFELSPVIRRSPARRCPFNSWSSMRFLACDPKFRAKQIGIHHLRGQQVSGAGYWVGASFGHLRFGLNPRAN